MISEKMAGGFPNLMQGIQVDMQIMRTYAPSETGNATPLRDNPLIGRSKNGALNFRQTNQGLCR